MQTNDDEKQRTSTRCVGDITKVNVSKSEICTLAMECGGNKLIGILWLSVIVIVLFESFVRTTCASDHVLLGRCTENLESSSCLVVLPNIIRVSIITDSVNSDGSIVIAKA